MSVVVRSGSWRPRFTPTVTEVDRAAAAGKPWKPWRLFSPLGSKARMRRAGRQGAAQALARRFVERMVALKRLEAAPAMRG